MVWLEDQHQHFIGPTFPAGDGVLVVTPTATRTLFWIREWSKWKTKMTEVTNNDTS